MAPRRAWKHSNSEGKDMIGRDGGAQRLQVSLFVSKFRQKAALDP